MNRDQRIAKYLAENCGWQQSEIIGLFATIDAGSPTASAAQTDIAENARKFEARHPGWQIETR